MRKEELTERFDADLSAIVSVRPEFHPLHPFVTLTFSMLVSKDSAFRRTLVGMQAGIEDRSVWFSKHQEEIEKAVLKLGFTTDQTAGILGMGGYRKLFYLAVKEAALVDAVRHEIFNPSMLYPSNGGTQPSHPDEELAARIVKMVLDGITSGK